MFILAGDGEALLGWVGGIEAREMIVYETVYIINTLLFMLGWHIDMLERGGSDALGFVE
jgi:hypothetical protein